MLTINAQNIQDPQYAARREFYYKSLAEMGMMSNRDERTKNSELVHQMIVFLEDMKQKDLTTEQGDPTVRD